MIDAIDDSDPRSIVEPDLYEHFMSPHNYMGWDEDNKFLPKSIFNYTACGKLVSDVWNASPEGNGQPKANCPKCVENKEQFKKDCIDELIRRKKDE